MQTIRTAFPSSSPPIYEEPPSSLLDYRHTRPPEDDFHFLQNRLGRLHAKLRLGIEADHEAQVFGQGINYFHIENLTFITFCHWSLPKIDRIILARPQERSANRNSPQLRYVASNSESV